MPRELRRTPTERGAREDLKVRNRDLRNNARNLLTVAVGALAVVCMLSAAPRAASPLPLRVCVVDDRSGAAADNGIESLNGIKMVIDPLNAKGGINGREIELITYDGKTDPQLSATFATRCAEDDQGLMLIGGSPSAPAAAMIPVAIQNQIPFYILAASANSLTDDAVWQFRFGPRAAQDAIAIADTLDKLGFKNVAIINNSTPFGTDTSRSTAKAVEAKGISVLTQQTYDTAATDVSPQVINLRQANAQVILAFPYPADGARVARTIRQLGVATPIVMPRVGLLASFRKLAGEAADGILVPTSVDVSRPEVAHFFEDYNSKFKPVAPSPNSAQGYDAATLAVTVLSDPEVEKAIDSGDLAAARKSIRDATERLGNFQGIQGQKGALYHFGPGQHHGPPDKGFFVFTQVAGKGEQLVQPDLSQFKPKN
jgi:branched-chain amino acid transport system substrate-binding protein